VNLLRAEWQRFFARRFTRIMLVLIALLLAVIAIGTAHDSRRVTPSELATAQQGMEADTALQQQQLTKCEQAQSGTAVEPDYQLAPGETCSDRYGNVNPQLEWYLPNTWTFARDGQDVIVIFGGLLALFGFATGASFIGAEWHSGGMMNLLLWRPRRLALLTQKLGALLLAVLASGLGLGLVWALMIWGLVSTRGQMGHVTAGMWQSFGLVGLRAFVLGLVATIIGFSIASIGRHTATALGVAVGYVVVVEAGGQIFLSMLNVARPERFLLSRYLAAWLFQTQHYFNAPICTDFGGGMTNCSDGGQWVMRMGSAAEVVGILAVALLAWAGVSFWRRDVT
jgi:ABC-type transport system involved in multi-copper enzyme maturation permease subunit